MSDETESTATAVATSGGSVNPRTEVPFEGGESGIPVGDGNTQGTVSKHFYDDLPDDLRGNPNITKHADVAGLAKSYIELSKKLGAKGLTPLPEGATPEQIAARRAIRRGAEIDTPEKYSYQLPKEYADVGMHTNNIKQILFDAGVDNETYGAIVEGVAKWEMNEAKKADADTVKAVQEAEDMLRHEWGENFETNVKANQMFMRKFPEAIPVFEELNLMYIPEIQLMLHKLNALTADGEIRLEKANQKSIEERLDEIETSDAYKQQWHDGHSAAMAKRAELIMKLSRR